MEVWSKKRQSVKSSTSENPVPMIRKFCAAGFRFLAKKYVITDAAPTTPETTKGSQSPACPSGESTQAFSISPQVPLGLQKRCGVEGEKKPEEHCPVALVLGFVVSQDEASLKSPWQPAAKGDSVPIFKDPLTIKSAIKTITLTGKKSCPVCTAAILHAKHSGTGQCRVVPICTAESVISPRQSTWPTHRIGRASRAVDRLTRIPIPDGTNSIPCAIGIIVGGEMASCAVKDG